MYEHIVYIVSCVPFVRSSYWNIQRVLQIWIFYAGDFPFNKQRNPIDLYKNLFVGQIKHVRRFTRRILIEKVERDLC